MSARNGRGLERVRDIVRSCGKPYGSTYVRGWCCGQPELLDEAQGEVDKKSVKFKMFTKEALGWKKCDNKDEQGKEDARCEAVAAAWKAEQPEVWSDVQHSDKGWFVAYCRQGELISKAVQAVNETFKLNVPLDAGYVLGRSWRDCH